MQSADQSRQAPFDLASIGETMIAFVSLDDPRHYIAVPAGAESNVAVGMARLGCRTQWVSRLGDDPLGRLIETSLVEAGVAVDVVRDPARPTGVMTIRVDGSDKMSTYYRSTSAARSLSVDDLERLGHATWVHVTGITPALSERAAEMVTLLLASRSDARPRISFDVNYRARLWPDSATAADTLLPLARAADIVFIGNDEAQELFGTAAPSALAESIIVRDDQELVLKRGSGSASVMVGATEISEPSLPAEMIESTGAGDAFAAGYLAGTVFGWKVRARLRLGHLMASRTIAVLDHVAPPLSETDLDMLSPTWLETMWATAENHAPS